MYGLGSAGREAAEQCLELGLNVFVEKPLAHRLADAEAMQTARQIHPKAAVAVGFMKSHEGLYQEMDRLLKANAIGRVERFEATCYLSQVLARKGSSWIYNKALSRRRYGDQLYMSPAPRVCANGSGRHAVVTATCKSIHSKEVEDEATIDLDFDNFRPGSHILECTRLRRGNERGPRLWELRAPGTYRRFNTSS